MGGLGTSYNARPGNVRMFLRADSAEGLVRLQLKNNVYLKGQASYTDVTQAADGKWYCWFLVDMDEYPEYMKAVNGTPSGRRRSGI